MRLDHIGVIRPAFVLAFLGVLTAARAQNPPSFPQSPGSASRCQAQMTDLLHLSGTLNRLRAAQSAPPSINTSIEALLLNRQFDNAISSALVRIDAAIANIDEESAELALIQNYVQQRNTHAQGLINRASLIVGTGVGVIGSSLQFSATTANAGNAVSVSSGVAALALGIYAVRGRTQPVPSTFAVRGFPVMLSALLSNTSPSAPPPQYPAVVWEYLTSNTCSPFQMTWREVLIQDWNTLLRNVQGPATNNAPADLVANLKTTRKFSIWS
jgi:hypothetical protein